MNDSQLQDIVNNMSDEEYNRIRFRMDCGEKEPPIAFWLNDDNYFEHLEKQENNIQNGND